MAWLHYDGADKYGGDLSRTHLLHEYAEVSGWEYAKGQGRFGGDALRNSEVDGYIHTKIPPRSRVRWAGHIKNPSLYGVSTDFLNFISANGTEIGFDGDAAGRIRVRRGGTTIATGPTVIDAETWHYFQIDLLLADAGGLVILRVDDNEEINFSGDTLNVDPLIRRITVGDFGVNKAAQEFAYLDDMMIWDDQGEYPTHFPLGQRRIVTLYPVADVLAEWTPSAGTDNFAMVDEADADLAATYVQSNLVNDRDIYTMDDLPTVLAVEGVRISALARKTEVARRRLEVGIRSNLIESIEAPQEVLTDWKYLPHYRGVDPNTGVQWIEAGVNAVEGIIEVDL